jgi:hypothetical protein
MRMPRFPDSPEGVALALAYLVAQSKEKQPDAQPADMIELARIDHRVTPGHPAYPTFGCLSVPEMSGGGDRRRDRRHPALTARTPTAPPRPQTGAGFFLNHSMLDHLAGFETILPDGPPNDYRPAGLQDAR